MSTETARRALIAVFKARYVKEVTGTGNLDTVTHNAERKSQSHGISSRIECIIGTHS